MTFLKSFQEEQDKQFQEDFCGDARDGWQDSAVAHIHSREEALYKLLLEDEKRTFEFARGIGMADERKRIGEEVEKMHGKVALYFHGMQCQEGKRPCGLENPSQKLADRCEIKKYCAVTLDDIKSILQ